MWGRPSPQRPLVLETEVVVDVEPAARGEVCEQAVSPRASAASSTAGRASRRDVSDLVTTQA